MQLFGRLEGSPLYHCPRCGTVKHWGIVSVPKLVDRCRQFGDALEPLRELCKRLGIAESINVPGERPQ